MSANRSEKGMSCQNKCVQASKKKNKVEQNKIKQNSHNKSQKCRVRKLMSEYVKYCNKWKMP